MSSSAFSLRPFWRIVLDFDFIREADGTTTTVPRLFVDMILWDVSTGTRVGRQVKDIPFVVDPPDSVIFEDGMAKFMGGYIRGVFNREQIEQALIDNLVNTRYEGITFGELSHPFGDENICLVARVRLPEEEFQEERPIFYMGQPTTRGEVVGEGERGQDVVCLIETVKNGDERKVIWQISGDRHEAARIFRIADNPDNNPPRGFHRLRVNQDTGISSVPYVYEILADSFPLDGPLPAIPSSHKFHMGETEFFIGGMPDGSGGMIGLWGQISYLDFDPNSSCTNCFG